MKLNYVRKIYIIKINYTLCQTILYILINIYLNKLYLLSMPIYKNDISFLLCKQILIYFENEKHNYLI